MSKLDNCELLDNWARTEINFPDRQYWYPCIDGKQLNQLKDCDFLKYRTDAAVRTAKVLGAKPVLAISGGIDSQAMLQSFVEAGVEFTAAHLQFKDQLNSHDSQYARAAAQRWGIELVTVELDVVKFLHSQLWKYAERYQCTSPQFACHNWFYEQLILQGYTGIAMGGDSWTPVDNQWHWSSMDFTQTVWSRFAKVNAVPVMGNFLSSTWQLCISLACCYDQQTDIFQGEVGQENFGELAQLHRTSRYQEKLKAFKRYGFTVQAQENKTNGFEKVKQRYIDPSGDAWAFEKLFRWPLQKKYPMVNSSELVLDGLFTDQLSALYQHYSQVRI